MKLYLITEVSPNDVTHNLDLFVWAHHEREAAELWSEYFGFPLPSIVRVRGVPTEPQHGVVSWGAVPLRIVETPDNTAHPAPVVTAERIAAADVHPGDTLVVETDQNLSHKQRDLLREYVKKMADDLGMDVGVMVLSGGVHLGILRGHDR